MEKCLLCNVEKDGIELIKLNCNHRFCWICFEDYLKNNLNSKIKCPAASCCEMIRDNQIRKVLCLEDIDKYESLCLKNLSRTHYCLLTQCRTPFIYENPDVQFECTHCTLYNCIKCQAAHGFIGCKTFQSKSPTEKVRICEQEIKRAELIFNNKKADRNREMLLELDTIDLINNDSVFTCDLCCLDNCKVDGVKLQKCGDLVCKKCLVNSIEKSTKIPAQCPLCQESINDREIRAVLSNQQFLFYQEKCQEFSKQFITHFQCQTPDCDAFYEISNSLKEFTCKKCEGKNCIKCKTVHLNENCEQFKIRMEADVNLKAIEEKIKEKKLMRCPKCSNLIMKTMGCNWIQCSNCSTELCWIRQMERWGPGGRGDISGGCKCGVDNIPCDPQCIFSCSPHIESNGPVDTDPFLDFLMDFHMRLLLELLRPNNI